MFKGMQAFCPSRVTFSFKILYTLNFSAHPNMLHHPFPVMIHNFLVEKKSLAPFLSVRKSLAPFLLVKEILGTIFVRQGNSWHLFCQTGKFLVPFLLDREILGTIFVRQGNSWHHFCYQRYAWHHFC